MFKNLYNIMNLEGTGVEDIAIVLGIHRNTLTNKLNGDSDFTLTEAEKIHSMFKKYEFDYIFTRQSKAS